MKKKNDLRKNLFVEICSQIRSLSLVNETRCRLLFCNWAEFKSLQLKYLCSPDVVQVL